MKFLKKVLPHLVALLVFGSVSAMFFSPQYSGKALGSHDMLQHNGMKQDIEEHVAAYGEHPQWAGRMFSGMPAYLIDMNYDGRYVKNVADKVYFIGQPAAFLFVAMATFYLMLIMFGVNPWLAIVGGLGYGLSTYFPIIIAAGHITKMMALAWIPALIGSIGYAYRKNCWLGGALSGFFASIVISTSHPQILYYFLFVILAMAINEFVKAYKKRAIKGFVVTSAVLLLAGGLAIGSNAVQLYYVADHSSETIRGKSELTQKDAQGVVSSGLDKDYATAWSYGIGESFNLFIPRLMGEGSGSGFAKDGEVAQSLQKYEASHIAPQLPSYWGDQPITNGGVYIGALLVFLFVFGMFTLQGYKKWWIFGAMTLALVLAWGHNAMWLTDVFLDYMPLYNKFRVPSMILVVLEFGIPLLAILALQKLFNEVVDAKKIEKALYYSLGICGGFALFAALILPSFLSFSGASDGQMSLPEDVVAAMQMERADMLRSDALRSLLFVVLGASVIFAYIKNWVKSTYVIAGLAVLVVVDLYSVDRRFVQTDDFTPKHQALAITPTEADKQILTDTTNFRVANFTKDPFSDATTSHFHRSVGGYHAAKLRRYQDLIDQHLRKNNMAVYDMLNTKYFITEKGAMVNENALGNAWFVDSIAFVPNADSEINALGDGFNAAKVAIVDNRFKEQFNGVEPWVDSTAQIALTNYKVNHLTYSYSADKEGVVVFSEIYFKKGWSAKIDGVETPYFRADYVLRGVVVPAGKHTIEWTFTAPHFNLIVNITRICSLILILSTIILLTFIAIKAFKKQTEK